MHRILLLALFCSPGLLSAQLSTLSIELQPWAQGLVEPVGIANADDQRLFILERNGRVKVVADSMQVLETPFLDIRTQVNSSYGEQGLLGLAFDPGYADNGYFYVYYCAGSGPGSSRLSRFQVSDDPNVADPTSEVVLYTVDQPFVNHKGGDVHFGRDGYLYLGFGDGGSGNDPQGNGQSPNTPLGSMIRIDVSEHSDTYAIPADNPFVGAADALPEVWAYGLRNPWRWSFDRSTGDMWIADVGQSAFEEVDHWPAGEAWNSGPNFGWRCREGLVPTPGISHAGCPDEEELVAPVRVFGQSHYGWCAIIGGYVYRGSQYPRLEGKYIFTDHCAGDFVSLDAEYHLDTLLVTDNSGHYSAFGEGVDGELYVADMHGGKVWKIADACPMPEPIVEFDGELLTSTDADGWQWYLNGTPIQGANENSYTPEESGSYTVVARFGEGLDACQLTSEPVEVILTGIGEQEAPSMSVYPQPATASLVMESTWDGLRSVELIDTNGRVVRRAVWPTGTDKITLDVADLPAGNYVLRANDVQGPRWASVVQVAK